MEEQATTTTDLVAQGAAGGLSAFLDANNAFTDIGNEYQVQGDILSFSGNTGEYKHKTDAVEHGTSLIFNVFEMSKGWMCWKDGKPIDKKTVKINSRQPAPAQSSLEEHGPYAKEGDGWKEYMVCPVTDLEGEKPQLELGFSNKTGVGAMARLCVEYGQKVRMNLDDKGRPKMPVVEIGASSFQPKKFPGTKWSPTFKIIDWISIDDMDEMRSAKTGDEEGPEEDPSQVEVAPALPAAAKAPTPAAAAAGFQANRVGKRV